MSTADMIIEAMTEATHKIHQETMRRPVVEITVDPDVFTHVVCDMLERGRIRADQVDCKFGGSVTIVLGNGAELTVSRGHR